MNLASEINRRLAFLFDGGVSNLAMGIAPRRGKPSEEAAAQGRDAVGRLHRQRLKRAKKNLEVRKERLEVSAERRAEVDVEEQLKLAAAGNNPEPWALPWALQALSSLETVLRTEDRFGEPLRAGVYARLS